MPDKWVVLDWESRSLCDLKKAGTYRYSIDPTTELLCGAYENHKGTRGLWLPGQPCPFSPEVLRDYTFIAHNALFEIWMWQNVATPDYGWPECPPLSQWHDTMARALQLALPAGLDNVLRALKAPVSKDKEGSKLTISLSKIGKKTQQWPDLTPEIIDRVGAYCLNDIADEVWLHKRIGWLPAEERACWETSMEMNFMGLGLDTAYVDAAQAIVDEASKPLIEEFRALTGVGVNQRDKILAWCRENGLETIHDMTKETLKQLLGSDEDGEADDDASDPEADGDQAHVVLPENVERALKIRQLVGSASIKKLAAMKACVGWDSRARGLLVYHGTTPGRQTAKIVQPHNFPRGTVTIDDAPPDPQQLVDLIKTRDWQLLEAVYGRGAVEIIVSSLRHGIVAAPGHALLAGDYAGIQLRTVLALAGQHDKVALMAANDRGEAKYNAYLEMSELIYHRPISKVANLAEYTIGKNAVLGLGFQGGGGMFQTKMAPKESREFCDEVVRVYRKEWAPQVPPLWYGLQDAAVKAVWTGVPHEAFGVTYSREDIWLKATIHNGTSIYYAYPERCMEQMPWDPTEERKGFTYWVQKQGRWTQRHAFGGQLTENVVMKIEREIMEGAKRRLKAAGYRFPFEVHDELIAERPASEVDMAEFKGIMEAVEPWVRELKIPINVEAWTGERYKK